MLTIEKDNSSTGVRYEGGEMENMLQTEKGGKVQKRLITGVN